MRHRVEGRARLHGRFFIPWKFLSRVGWDSMTRTSRSRALPIRESDHQAITEGGMVGAHVFAFRNRFGAARGGAGHPGNLDSEGGRTWREFLRCAL